MDLVEVLEQINKASLRFLQPLTPEATYRAIIDEAIKLVQADEGYLALAKNNELSIKYAYVPFLGPPKMRRRGFTYTAFSQKKAYVTYAEDFKEVHPELVKAGIQSTIFIPIVNKGKSMGVMNIMSHHRLRKFTQKELSILKLFGSMASLAIHKTQLYSETKTNLEARNLFLSMAAHEFRTPITTISGYAQLLRNKIGEDRLEKRWVEDIYRETLRLTRLIEELLEVNRIHLGHFHYNWQENNLVEVLDKAIEDFIITYPNNQLNYKNTVAKEDANVICDRDKITQVLNNILDNATKFSPKIKKVNIFLKKRGEELVIQIRDYGLGINQQDMNKVFEGFYRGTNNTKEGMGLGLYLSHQIIKEHKGRISIKSKIDKGTTVEICLPKINIDKVWKSHS
ncbi:GAF domain-containing sensor histidine kinase [Candidatus Daviesbacteria bacterium]|nr:GAF domain-containing sensor histidine kinase [Candidatus Daviesbacteria bacterium]